MTQPRAWHPGCVIGGVRFSCARANTAPRPTPQIHMVYSKRSGKPRGYAFIEYEHERDMHCEYLPPAPGPLTLSLLPRPLPVVCPHLPSCQT